MEKESVDPAFWDDSRQAQRKMRELARQKETVDLWRDLESRADALQELTDLAIEEGDNSFQDQLEQEAAEIFGIMAREEINLTLSGAYDERSAIVSIHAGVGGTDSHDWAEMLLRMYVKWAEAEKRPVQVMDMAYGDEAGLRSGTLEIGGARAYGYLSSEIGAHRLVRLSPFDPDHLRHTSFASVEVLPAGGRRRLGRNGTSGRSQDGLLPFQRTGRSKRPEGCVGSASNAHTHWNRHQLPERALSTPKPGVCNADSEVQAAGHAG